MSARSLRVVAKAANAEDEGRCKAFNADLRGFREGVGVGKAFADRYVASARIGAVDAG